MRKVIPNLKPKKIGDVYEIETSKGLAYFQYTHEHKQPPKWGSLIRVLHGGLQSYQYGISWASILVSLGEDDSPS